MAEEQGTAGGGATFTQQQVDSMIGQALHRERQKFADYDDLKKRAEAAEAAAEAQKSELQKLQTSVDDLAKSLQDERLDSAKKDVAVAHKLTPAQAAYLKGTTPDELAASAKQLQTDFGIKVDDAGTEGADDKNDPPTPPAGQQTATAGGAQHLRRPTDTLTGAGTPVQTGAPDELDPDKLADLIGRR